MTVSPPPRGRLLAAAATLLTAAAAALLFAAAAALLNAGGAAAADRALPYWASLGAGQARMRTGPGRNYPASWLYRRAGLPVRVVQTYPGWRKVRDPDGAEGWMIASLISAQRTGIVGGGGAELRDAPDADARVLWHAGAGVVGKLSHCGSGWCRIDVTGRAGYVETARLWGVDPDETIG